MDIDKMGQIGEKKGEKLLYNYFGVMLPLFSINWMSIKGQIYIANIVIEILNEAENKKPFEFESFKEFLEDTGIVYRILLFNREKKEISRGYKLDDFKSFQDKVYLVENTKANQKIQKKAEDYLHNLGEECFEIDRMSKEKGIWVLNEIKNQEPFEPRP